PRGLREAPPVPNHEARGRPTRVVRRVFLRGPERPRPGPLGEDAPGSRGLRTLVRRPPRGGLSGGPGRTKPPGRHVLRREVHVRSRGVPGGGPPQAHPAGGTQGAPALQEGPEHAALSVMSAVREGRAISVQVISVFHYRDGRQRERWFH